MKNWRQKFSGWRKRRRIPPLLKLKLMRKISISRQLFFDAMRRNKVSQKIKRVLDLIMKREDQAKFSSMGTGKVGQKFPSEIYDSLINLLAEHIKLDIDSLRVELNRCINEKAAQARLSKK